MQATPIRNVAKGEFIMRKADAKTVYVRGEYDRSTKSYSCTAADDMCKEIFIKADKPVFVGFTY
jgi:hypothetical protein